MPPKSPQKTVLDDNAAIYQRREQKSEKQKLSEMSFSEKVSYLKTYYLKIALATLVIGGFLIWFLITVLMPKPDRVLSVALVNTPMLQEDLDQMEVDITDLLNVDPDTQEVFIDTNFNITQYDYSTAQKLTTYIYSGEIDLFIAPESIFSKYAYIKALWPLTDLLPTDFYSTLKASDLFVCNTRENDDEVTPSQATGPEGVFGIYLSDIDMFDIYDNSADPPVIGVMITAKNKENAISYLKYLLNN